MPICNPYYKCNSWNCNYCASTKLFWLREQALNFAARLTGQDLYFTTVKGTTAIEHALNVLKSRKGKITGRNTRYNAKKEHFYVLAKHQYSKWHIHIISNYKIDLPDCHQLPVRSSRASCLYLVENLKWSLRADYGGRRRYGASSLLYMQSMRNWLKTRIRLWRAITRYLVAMVLLRALSNLVFRSSDVYRQRQVVGNAKTLPKFKFVEQQKIRPPPIRDKWLIIASLSP